MKQYRSQLIIGLVFLLCTIAIIIFYGSREKTYDPVSVTAFKLDTINTITSYDGTGEDILKQCFDICDKYENIYSRTLESSELFAVNHATHAKISEELGDLIKTGLTYCELSNGAFDISIGGASSLWNFNTDKPSLPDAELIAKALSTINYKDIKLEKVSDGWTIDIPKDMVIDLGAIAKGYIADKIKEFLVSKGATHVVINLGHNILCIGGLNDYKDFTIGVQDPKGGTLETLSINGMSVVSSGNYERSFTLDGKLYHHILNPKTGYPCDNSLSQVTIISDSSTRGDALSTVCFTLGLEDGLALINSQDGVEALFCTKDGQKHYSDNFRKYIK